MADSHYLQKQQVRNTSNLGRPKKFLVARFQVKKQTAIKNSALLCYFPIPIENENIAQLSSITTYLHGCITVIANNSEIGS